MMFLYQCMLDEATGSCFVKLGIGICSTRLGDFDLLEILFDSGQFSKDRMALCIDTIEPKVSYSSLAHQRPLT